jgi:general stress protein 26
MEMSKDEIVAVALELAASHKPFMMGTVDTLGRPQMRWMGGLVLEEPLVIWMACGAKSRKIGQLQARPTAQLVFSKDDFSTVVTLSGRCELRCDANSKQKVWDGIPGLAQYNTGPDDPKLAVLRFVTKRIEVLRVGEGLEPQVAEL